MFDTAHLRPKDVRAALGLMSQLRGLESDRGRLIRALVAGIANLLHARLVVAGKLRRDPAGGMPALHDAHAYGAADAAERCAFSGPDIPPRERDPALEVVSDRPGRCVTATRFEIVDAEYWRTTEHHRRFWESRESGAAMYSLFRAEAGLTGCIVVHRSPAQGEFAAIKRELMHAFHAECGEWLWSAKRAVEKPPAPGPPPIAELKQMLERMSRAQRAVLPFLLEGATEHEIARTINRSRYTVHDHTRAIYAACGVKSRVELVLRFSGVERAAIPAMIDEPEPFVFEKREPRDEGTQEPHTKAR